MMLLREVQEQDIGVLEQFSQIPGFINIPDDREQLRDYIKRSKESFSRSNETFYSEGKYVFVVEDLEKKRVVGTSMIASQHGTEDSPHFYFEVDKEQKFSDTLNTGFIHGTLNLKIDPDGPSEIGGLVIDPEYRNHASRVGRQISFIRFLYLGLHPKRFKEVVLAELLPPLNKKGRSPLWEAIGRRFTNMDYWEADKLSRANKEFALALFPSGKIYTSFITAEARNAIGKVGKDTEPVLHMLKKIGFKYRNHVDPFDGGPHLIADVKDIKPIKNIQKFKFNPLSTDPGSGDVQSGLISKANQAVGQFRAQAVEITRNPAAPDSGQWFNGIDIEGLKKNLSLSVGDELVFMPYY